MIENIETASLVTNLFKIILSAMWFLFLLLGITTIQQIREMQEVIKVPNKRRVWMFYLAYVVFAAVMFSISILTLWIPR